ncbi:hypothetical protein A2Z10_02690 [Candidatus Azambacteria bacterium RBG_16_47_10]|uniref:Urease accessory protein UreH-like transmembrane domain-containing protein n=1 Tax=Candidatus Azambacteria bacterium RBG_16_47_10 TaxID=1797292 RepID=A0A1F5B157_9BACT|nr:MAG: hypothetical protein A2Z10_02690 [Candidatus Azambacteria bacterium RBG_16_47_10]
MLPLSDVKNKTIGSLLILGSVLYLSFTSFIAGHGFHPLNILITIFLLVFGFVTIFKTEQKETTASQGKTAETAPDEISALQPTQKFKIFFVSLAFGLLTAIIIALTYLATSAGETLTTILSFAGGVSNIVLPCTLPLVFIIVPLSMGKGYKKGLVMALLFGLGLTVMLAIYGAGIALVGKYLGLDQATRILYIIAGIAAFVFGLSTLALIKFEMPSYSKVPSFIQRQPDYFKSLFLGFFLGNAGIGCPNPITYLILTAAAGTGSMAVGAWYMAVNGLGRALPLIFLSVLGILGVNAAGGLLKRKITVDKITGWALVAISMFIILNGVFGHLWYEGSLFHDGLNMIFGKLGGEQIAEAEIPIEQFEQSVPYYTLGAWLNLLLPLLILIWYYLKKRGEMTKKTFWMLLFIFIIWGLLTMPIGFTMG